MDRRRQIRTRRVLARSVIFGSVAAGLLLWGQFSANPRGPLSIGSHLAALFDTEYVMTISDSHGPPLRPAMDQYQGNQHAVALFALG